MSNKYSNGPGRELVDEILSGAEVSVENAEEFATWLVASRNNRSNGVLLLCHNACMEGGALPWQQTVTAVSEAYCLHMAVRYKDEAEAYENLQDKKNRVDMAEDEIRDDG